MRSFTLILLSAAIGHVAAFSTPPSSFARSKALAMSTHMDKDYTAGSGMTEHEIGLFIDNLTAENFDESLEMLEPLLTNECVGEVCDDYVGRLKEKADKIGKTVPKGYAATHH